MEILPTHCARLDANKKLVVSAILVSNENRQPINETRSFETMTVQLLALQNWLTG